MFTLFDLLDWFEDLLDDRANHLDEWYMLFATEERYVELNIAEHEVWAGAVTNRNLSADQHLSEMDVLKLGVLGWVPEELESPEPKFVRRWPANAPTSQIVAQILRAFTLIYLDPETELVEVVRGTFANGNIGWEYGG